MNQPSLPKFLLAGLLLCGVGRDFRSEAAEANWPQFRGLNGSGIAADAKPPVKFDRTNGVLWQVDVPSSPSSPCIWGDHIYLTTFADGELQTRCLDRSNGKQVWSKGIKTEKLETFHGSEGSPAASTPATDGKTVVCYFGSFGLVSYSAKGVELWRHPLPMAMSGGSFGSGTSPVIHGQLVLLNRDQDLHSSLLAVDLKTGKTVWEAPRPDATGSFGTPIIWQNEGVDEVVMPGSFTLKGYELKNGKERWRFDGVTGFACTTPVVGDGLLFFAAWSPGKGSWPPWDTFLSSNDKNHDGVLELSEFEPGDRDFARGMDMDHDGKISKADFDEMMSRMARSQNVLVAIKPGGQGNITQTHLAWKFEKGLPYVPSPLVYDGRLYMVRDGGMLSSFDAKTGTEHYTMERLDAIGSYYASPVAADGRIYVVSLNGKLTVVKAGGEKPEILHQAEFGERIAATPALVGDKLYLRTQTKLYGFREGK